MSRFCSALDTIQDPGSREAVARCFCLITAADGEVQPAEQQVLQQLLAALGQRQMMEEAPRIVARFQREDGAIDQALLTVGDVANRAGAKVGEAIGSAGKLFQKDKTMAVKVPELEFNATVEERTKAMILAAMNQLM